MSIDKVDVGLWFEIKWYFQKNHFYYNTKINRWDYTPNSSWKFLEDAKKQAEQPDNVNN